jgi:hypothetical protein
LKYGLSGQEKTMKTMFDVKLMGASSRMKVLTFFMLCALCAMVLTFVQVGKQAGIDQSRLADVAEQLVLSQRIAKYALAATRGDTDAFAKMQESKQEFSRILETQTADFGVDGANGAIPEQQALASLADRWGGFRNNIDEVLNGQVLIVATCSRWPHERRCECKAGQAGDAAGCTGAAYREQSQ